MTLISAGRGAHSAYQWLGDNALVNLERSVGNLLARYPVATEEAWRTTVTLARVSTQNQARQSSARRCGGLAGHPIADITTIAPYYDALKEFLGSLEP